MDNLKGVVPRIANVSPAKTITNPANITPAKSITKPANVTPAKTVSKPADITSVKSVSKPDTPAKINSPKSSPTSNATDVSKTPNKSEKVKTDNAKKRPQDFVAENDERTHKKIKSSSDLLEDNDKSKEGMNSSDKASLTEEHNKDHDSLGKKDNNDDGDDKIAKPTSTGDTKKTICLVI